MGYRLINIKTSQRQQFIDITPQITALLAELSFAHGVCCVYVPHTTAGVTINEGADPDVVDDILNHLNIIVPDDLAFKHREGNSQAHIKAMLVGTTATVPVDHGRLGLGTWQKIFFCEFDGPRSRRVGIKFIVG